MTRTTRRTRRARLDRHPRRHVSSDKTFRLHKAAMWEYVGYVEW